MTKEKNRRIFGCLGDDGWWRCWTEGASRRSMTIHCPLANRGVMVHRGCARYWEQWPGGEWRRAARRISYENVQID